MEILELPTARLRRRVDCRALNEDNVKNIMEAMQREGFWKSSPLRVRPIKIRELNNGNIDGWEITCGRHRFEAAWRLNFETAPCVIETEDDLHAELSMIDENLVRADLGPVDLAKQTKRRKVIHELLYPGAKAGTIRAGGMNKALGHDVAANLATTCFVEDTAKKTGRGERTVRRDVHRGENISDEAADRIRGTPLDNGAYLDKLEKINMEDQISTVERDLSSEGSLPKRGRPRNGDGQTVNGEAVASFIFANVDRSKIPMLISLLEGTRSKFIITALHKMLDA